MRIWLIALIAAIAGAPPLFARDFTYTYEGKTLTYTVIDEEAKTCKTKEGNWRYAGNTVSGDLIIPSIAKDGDVEYSVTSISAYAFGRLSGLTSVIIPNSVTSIGDYAFSNCSGLSELTIPNSVTSIGDYAFSNCSGLSELTIPNSVTSIGNYAFSGCFNVETLSIDCAEVGSWFNQLESIKSLTLGENVASIGESAFYLCSGLTIVTIGNSVTSIGDRAFSSCYNLTTVTIPNSVTSIGDGAFSYCRGLTSVTIGNSVTTIGNSVFAYCSGLPTVTIPNSVASIGKSAFSRCSGLTSVTIPNSVTSIGAEAFYECSGLTSLTIGNSVTSIGSSAFNSCKGLTTVSIPNSVTSIGSRAFWYCDNLTTLTIGNSVTSIGDDAFSGCSGLTSVTIPNSVTSLGQGAFSYCSGLIKSAYPEHLRNAFPNKVVAIAYPSDYSVIEDDFVYNSDKSTLFFAPLSLEGEYAIPKSVRFIGANAFYACNGLTSVTIPNFIWSIGASAFSGCSGLTTLTIPKYLAEIGANAFAGCTGLTGIVAKATYPPAMHANSFEGLYGMVNLDVPDGSLEAYLSSKWSLFLRAKEQSATEYTKTFSDNVFTYRLIPNDPSSPDPQNNPNTAVIVNADSYASMTNADIPYRVTDNGTRYYVKGIGYGAFAGCTSLTAVNFTNISRSVMQFIGENAFSGCSSLLSFTLPDKVRTIGDYAFKNCSYLISLSLPRSVFTIGYDAFRGCGNLREINIATDNPSYCSIDGIIYNKDASVLLLCPEAKSSVNIPESVAEIGNDAFYFCNRLTSVLIPNSVTSIGNDAFYGCPSLKKSAYPDNLSNPFSAGVAIAYPKDNSLIEDGFVFSADKSVVYFAPLTNIGEYAIPNSVTTIGDYAFSDCDVMTSVTMGSSVSSIGQYAFQNCTKMPEIEFGPSVTEIGAYAFAGCRLNNIRMGSNVTTIGEKAFDQSPATIVAITAQVPPTAPDNTFSNYTGSLYVQDKTGNQEVFDAYYDSDYCWYRFNSVAMIPATEIETDNATLDFAPGTTQQLNARVLPENATLPTVYWYSTNPAIASVDNNGLVTYHGSGTGGGEAPQHVRAQADAECKIIASTLYDDGPVAEFTVHGVTTGVDDIVGDGAESEIDFSAPVEVYNLNGVRVSGSVDNLAPGVYVVRQGAAVQKIVI